MEHSIIGDVALCIVVAWLLAVAAQLLRQPLILAYLAAGFLLGPVGFGWIRNGDSIGSISSLGLILLMFMIGLEIDLKKIIGSGRLITVVGILQIAGSAAVGFVVFWGAGFLPLEGLYLAVAMALSSTVIIVKLLYEKRELDTWTGRVTLGILVLQDLFAILVLAVQPELKNAGVGLIAVSLAKVAGLVAAAFAISRFALPPLFKAVARLPELVLVGALAWCFLVAGLAGQLGLSMELGALVAGVAISTFPYALDVTAKVTSLRDFFVTLFFVALGMAIPAPSWGTMGWAVLFSAVLVLSRLLTVYAPLYRGRQGHRASLLPAIHLSQVSELSLVIVSLGVAAGHIGEETRGIVAYAFVLMAALSAYAIFHTEGLAQKGAGWLVRLGFKDLGGPQVEEAGHKPTIFLLGFCWTGSSLLEWVRRLEPEWLKELAVIDFNPSVNQSLQERGVRVIYGHISHRGTLLHAGVGEAEIIVCTLANTILKGTTNLRLLQQLREINSSAEIIVQAELLADIPQLYEAGASYVLAPRLLEAEELGQVLASARNGMLEAKRQQMNEQLKEREEVVP